MPAAELSPIPANKYERSARQLFTLLDTHYDQSGPPHYFKVTWDHEDTAIQDIVVMDIVPTGARKHEMWGEFYSAQFRISETAAAGQGETTQRFIWCSTGPQRPGTPIELDPWVLAVEHDYFTINPANLIDHSARRARSVDDYLSLIKIMQHYSAQPTKELTANINGLIYRFTHQGFMDRDETTLLDQDKMFELISSFYALQPRRSQEVRTSSHVEGYLLSQLLRAIAQKRTPTIAKARDVADNAAMVLESALQKGIIGNSLWTTDRIFASTAVYGYPFATERLYAKLESHPDRGSSTHIFGVRRAVFVSGYIREIVRSRVPDLAAEADYQALMHFTQGREERPLHQLMHLLQLLTERVNDTFLEPAESAARSAPEFISDVSQSFAYILSRLPPDPLLSAENQADFNAKCVQIVKRILNRRGARLIFPIIRSEEATD